jgi:hypothetical protein
VQLFNGDTVELRLNGTFVTMRADDCPIMAVRQEMMLAIEETGNGTENSTTTRMRSSDDDDETVFGEAEMHLMAVDEMSVDALSAINDIHVWIRDHSDWLPPHHHVVVLTK